jgi:hypothetical protein
MGTTFQAYISTPAAEGRETEAAAAYAALAAGDKQAYQAAIAQYAAANNGAVPGALQSNPWNPPGVAPPSSNILEDPTGQVYVGSSPAAAAPIGSADVAHTAALVRATLSAPIAPPVPLKPATGRGELVSAERLRTLFVPVGGVIAGVGGPVGIVVGAVFSFLGGLFGGLFGGGGDANAAIKQLRDEFVNVTNAVIEGYSALARTVGTILKWIGAVVVEFLKTLLDLVKHLVEMLKDLYQKVLKPALKAIQDIRNNILRLYEKWIRPALIVIQKIRQVLAILKLFHVKFAAKLDAQLAQLEYKITQPLFFILRYVNSVANLLNLIMTAANVMQRPFFLASLNAYKGSSIALITNSMNPPVDYGALTDTKAARQVPSIQQTSTDFDEYAAAQAGAFAGTTGAADDQFAKAVAQVG